MRRLRQFAGNIRIFKEFQVGIFAEVRSHTCRKNTFFPFSPFFPASLFLMPVPMTVLPKPVKNLVRSFRCLLRMTMMKRFRFCRPWICVRRLCSPGMAVSSTVTAWTEISAFTDHAPRSARKTTNARTGMYARHATGVVLPGLLQRKWSAMMKTQGIRTSRANAMHSQT